MKIIPKKFERIEDDIATRNIINNIIEINNDNSLLDRNDKFNSTEINCIYNVDKNGPRLSTIIAKIKELEYLGYPIHAGKTDLGPSSPLRPDLK